MDLLMILEKIKKSSLVDLLAIITPFVIIMGLMHKIGIYTSEQVDASWFISIFTPTDFMLSDLTIYIFFITSIFYLDKAIFKPGSSVVKEIFWANFQLSAGYAGILISLWYRHKSYDEITLYYFLMALSLNGFGIIFLSKRLGKIFGLALLLLVPYLSGKKYADQLLEEKLPIVELDDHKKWYLLDKHSDQLILINNQAEKNEFKVVDMKEIKILK